MNYLVLVYVINVKLVSQVSFHIIDGCMCQNVFHGQRVYRDQCSNESSEFVCSSVSEEERNSDGCICWWSVTEFFKIAFHLHYNASVGCSDESTLKSIRLCGISSMLFAAIRPILSNVEKGVARELILTLKKRVMYENGRRGDDNSWFRKIYMQHASCMTGAVWCQRLHVQLEKSA